MFGSFLLRYVLQKLEQQNFSFTRPCMEINGNSDTVAIWDSIDSRFVLSFLALCDEKKRKVFGLSRLKSTKGCFGGLHKFN